MKEKLYLTASQINRLLDSLHDYHREYGALGTILDETKETLLIENFRSFLEVFLLRPEQEEETVGHLAAGYHDQKVPFSLLMGAFNCFKMELIEQVASNLEKPADAYREIDRRFERAKRLTARAYLRLEVTGQREQPHLLVRDRLLIRLYEEWLEKVRRGIVEDLSLFPLDTVDESAFSRALLYPESMMICLDLKLCDQIRDQHRLILQQAGILYAMLAAHRFEQAYIAYQELVRNASELINLLGMLYFEADTNRIHRFFNFVQASLYLPGRKFFCVINLRQLGQINKMHGNTMGDELLGHIESRLHDELENNREWLLFTRGIAGDFYLLGHDVEPEPMQRLCERVEGFLREATDEQVPPDTRIVYHGIELTSLNELTTDDLHLVVEYLTDLAHRGDHGIDGSVNSSDTLLEWLREKYRRSIDLRARLTIDDTDIFIQPLVTLDQKAEIHGFEVLGRFREGEGFISAGMFIDDIIGMGMVVEFDRLVLRKLIDQAPLLMNITQRIFLNVASSSLEDLAYVDALTQALKGPLKDFEVILELTEQVLLERRDLITDLHRRHGLGFAIDDFGTGYSTLQLVIELALEGSIRYLKLDGSLTRDITTRVASERIMHITQQMARELNLETVVEVIETSEQLEKLNRMNMDIGQGYLLGVPDTVPVWQGKLTYLKSRKLSTSESSFAL